MPLYMITFGYQPEVWAGLVKSPENRTDTVSRMLEDAGCKLHGLWYAFGESDGFALVEAPDNVTGAGLSLAITSSGAFRKLETTVLMTQDEVLEALEKAQEVGYVAPAAGVHA
ncbi:MAG: GYD family protein [Candidatus Rokuibacteriota bacterium]|nr:MAG: GYD family protein [Candidatus Rokubacteria bacterium]